MIDEDLFALLGPLVSNRVYPSAVELKTPLLPYIVYVHVASSPENIIDGNGNPPINNTRLQVDVYAQYFKPMRTLAKAVTDAFLGWATPNVAATSQFLFESDTRLHRAILEFSIWHYD